MRVVKTLPETLILTLGFLMLLLMLSRPDNVARSFIETFDYLIGSVLPAIFPFMVMSSFLTFGTTARVLGLIFVPYTRYILKIADNRAGVVMFLSLAGGFVAGATSAARLLEQGVLNKEECKRLLPVIFIPSLPFSVLVAGRVFFDSFLIGLLFAVTNLIAALITASLMSIGAKCDKRHIKDSTKRISLAIHLVESVKSSSLNALYICGFILFFGTLTGVCSPVLPHTLSSAIAMMFEFSTALPTASQGGIFPVSVALSLLGLSSYCQVYIILGGRVSFKSFVLCRAICTFFNLALLFIATKLFLTVAPAILPTDNLYILPYQYSFELSIIAFLIIIISFKDFVLKKGLQQ